MEPSPTGGDAAPTSLPVGDGAVSTRPQRGSVWACETTFGGPGAEGSGPWIRGDGTFDPSAKPLVEGEIDWPDVFTATVEGETRLVQGNGLPDHPTGAFPIAPDSEAFQYDRNPNAVLAQSLRMEVPAVPEQAGEPSCTPLGAIGVLLTGSVFANALDAAGRDAVAHEIQDACQGHPEMRGAYHYHSLTPCLDEGESGHSLLVGYALDGFGLFGHRDQDGSILTNEDLDRCHGHRHAVDWDGDSMNLYHYHATFEYPYTMGCFRGVPGAPPIGA